ncbi:hypothetical protein F4819DRAFT_450015 [Hypoxylon fuscum]|nr:hypothetical protein F4819DRAFT_450015 [Hypoxylon fuscum]
MQAAATWQTPPLVARVCLLFLHVFNPLVSTTPSVSSSRHPSSRMDNQSEIISIGTDDLIYRAIRAMDDLQLDSLSEFDCLRGSLPEVVEKGSADAFGKSNTKIQTALGGTVDNCHQLLQFPQFRRLPPEIRAMIWDLATPRRVFGLQRYLLHDFDDGFPGYYFDPVLSPPSIAQVCRESREFACRSGKPVAIKIKNAISNPAPAIKATRDYPETAWSWYDPNRDTFHIAHRGDFVRPLADNVLCSGLNERTQHIAIDWSLRKISWTNLSYLSNPKLFPQLRTVDLIRDSFHPKLCLAHLNAQMPRFKYNSNPILMDINDEAAQKTLISKMKRDNPPDCATEGLEEFLAEARGIADYIIYARTDRAVFPDLCIDNWRGHLNHLKQEWIVSKYNWYPLGGGGRDVKPMEIKGEKRPGLSEQWTNANCPVFRRVVKVAHYDWASMDATPCCYDLPDTLKCL